MRRFSATNPPAQPPSPCGSPLAPHGPKPTLRAAEPSTAGRLRLRLRPTAEAAVRAGHPWVFDQSIRSQNRPGQLGELAVIYDRHDRFLALGLFDPDSPLRVRVLHVGRPVQVDRAWWRQRLVAAMQRRVGLFDNRTTGFRCIHGENDGWPGLVLDRYEQVLVLKLYTGAWLPHLAELTALIQAELQPRALVLRLSRNLAEATRARFQLHDGQVLAGELQADRAPFLETGLRFEADVRRGQKTGFFLDQRDNRRQVEALSAGRRVLNAFSFSGAFGLYAARGGARAVTDVDISPHALEAARRHFDLNRADPAVARCVHETLQADCFEWLSQARTRQFDLVILDPPSLAKSQAERPGALRAYHWLATHGLRLLRARGILVAASCSAHVQADEFFDVVRQAAAKARRRFVELATTGHPADHPATFPEAHYLKCIYLQVS
jgi:23S rRNA (cytosine1962-C5)-methyltransferase